MNSWIWYLFVPSITSSSSFQCLNVLLPWPLLLFLLLLLLLHTCSFYFCCCCCYFVFNRTQILFHFAYYTYCLVLSHALALTSMLSCIFFISISLVFFFCYFIIFVVVLRMCAVENLLHQFEPQKSKETAAGKPYSAVTHTQAHAHV